MQRLKKRLKRRCRGKPNKNQNSTSNGNEKDRYTPTDHCRKQRTLLSFHLIRRQEGRRERMQQLIDRIYAENTLSNCLRALASSPNPIFSLGISLGPSAATGCAVAAMPFIFIPVPFCCCSDLGALGGGGGGPFINAFMLGTVVADELRSPEPLYNDCGSAGAAAIC